MGVQPVGSSEEGSEDKKLDKNPQALFLHPCHRPLGLDFVPFFLYKP